MANDEITRSGSNELEGQTAPSLLWLASTNPALLNPITLEKGGMTQINFVNPSGQTVVSVYRTISRYIDGNVGIQDEVHPNFENDGVQFNFEVDVEGNIIQFSNAPQFTERMQLCVALIQEAIQQERGVVMARNRDYGFESHLISDGTSLIDSSLWEEHQSKSISSNSEKPLLSE